MLATTPFPDKLTTTGTSVDYSSRSNTTSASYTGRAHFQSTEALNRNGGGYEEGDVVAFLPSLEGVAPGDAATLQYRDGRVLEGTVGSVTRIDKSITIAL